ncbi:hypothetical protein Tco_0805979, partial [Tanacetum coccineum]
APLLPVHALEDLEYLAPAYNNIAPAEDQPLPKSPNALSPGYIADSEPIEDDFEKDPEIDPVDYAADEEEEEESSDDDDKEEEHLASADSALPIPDSVPSTGLRRARKTVRPQPLMATSIEALIAEYDSAPIPLSPPPSPLSPLSSPLLFIPSPPLLIPSHTSITTTISTAARQPGISLFRGTKIISALEEVKEDMTDLSSRQRLDSEEFHTCHQDTHNERALLQAQVSTLRRERRYHRHTAMLAEDKARYALQAWSHAMDCNRVVHVELLALRAESRHCMLRKIAQRKTPMTDAAIKQLIDQGVVDALVDYESNKSSGNGDDSHDSRSGERRTVPAARECTYSDFLKCQPLNFKGTEGVVGLTQWFEKMESIFHITTTPFCAKLSLPLALCLAVH